MDNPGEIIIWLALIGIFASSLFYLLLNFKEENERIQMAARLSFIGFAVFVTIASMLLMHYILNHDFRYSYVARYSSRTLPLEYLVSSFWAGQEGSFLLWVLLGAWLGLLLVFKAKELEPQVMLVYNLNNIFLTILLIKQSPFEQLVFAPPDGNGLNMLLQDPWMVIHPPIVFVGYAAFAIPFAYGVAGLWRREYDLWVKRALPWAAFAFVSLGAGIIIGGYWSYKVLGWGGYWGWDPVENASLLPWLAGIALLHGMILQRTRKKLRKTNFFLAAVSFILVIYCTFLTRSGVLADFSVHSFVDLGITGWLVLFMTVFLVISFGTLIARAREIPVAKKGDSWSYFSREFGLISAMILLCLSTVIIGLGTSAPLITRLAEKASKVSTEFYVDTNLPIAVFVLLLISFVPLLVWGRNSFSKLLSKLAWAAGGAIIAVTITLVHGYPGIGVLLIALLAGAAVGMNLFLMTKLMRKRFSIS
ncbi:MAG: cytochrome c biogenesis protein CcsA, partial [Deltaproteobacteria bacterium]|nr:cytochrome c biogenesis protein CcsA [Deltaproteobacteria bacterium]